MTAERKQGKGYSEGETWGHQNRSSSPRCVQNEANFLSKLGQRERNERELRIIVSPLIVYGKIIQNEIQVENNAASESPRHGPNAFAYFFVCLLITLVRKHRTSTLVRALTAKIESVLCLAMIQ
jgi:hypothetical protein